MTNLFIYGSCVSRDSYEFLDPQAFALTDYVARQSLISTFAAPSEIEEKLISISSPFQIKNLRGDFEGDLLRKLRSRGPETDVILWDLTDERLGVLDLGGGRYVTRSMELLASKAIDTGNDQGWIKFGSEKHLELWREAVKRFSAFLTQHRFMEKVVLLNLPWAAYDETGAPVGSYWSMSPSEANTHFADYVQVITEELACVRLERPWRKALADTGHQWTLSPYHYDKSVYSDVTAVLTELAQTKPLGTSRADGPTNVAGSQEPLPPGSAAMPGGTVTTGHWISVDNGRMRFQLDRPMASFSLEFEGKATTGAGNHMLVSLGIQPPTGFVPSEHDLALSHHASIGYFRYVHTRPGERRYYASFDLPPGAECRSVTIQGWQLGGATLQLRNVDIFGPSDVSGAEP
jgi:hypothetical protein